MLAESELVEESWWLGSPKKGLKYSERMWSVVESSYKLEETKKRDFNAGLQFLPLIVRKKDRILSTNFKIYIIFL